MSDSMLLLFPLNEWFSFFSVHLNQLMYLKIYRCLGHAIRNSDYLRPGCGIFKEAWVTNVHQKMNKEDVLLIYTHNGILLGPKKNQIMSFAATWMNLEIIILSEVNQTEKHKYYMIIIHILNLKYDTNELTHKTNRLTDRSIN